MTNFLITLRGPGFGEKYFEVNFGAELQEKHAVQGVPSQHLL
jgi:hypothetical protein